MKKSLLLTLAIAFISFASYAQNEAAPGTDGAVVEPGAEFKWEEETHDFGQIPQGTPATTRYYFTNVGKAPLVVENVKPTCGCTTPTWTKEEIKPGERGFVEATYNAAAPGSFNKGITVVSNTSTPTKMLYLKGEVLKKEEVDFHDNGMMQNHQPGDGHDH